MPKEVWNTLRMLWTSEAYSLYVICPESQEPMTRRYPLAQSRGRGSLLTFCFLKACKVLILWSNIHYYPSQNSLIINASLLFSHLYLKWRDKFILRIIYLLEQNENLNFLSCIFRKRSPKIYSQYITDTGYRSIGACYPFQAFTMTTFSWGLLVWCQAITGSIPTQLHDRCRSPKIPTWKFSLNSKNLRALAG